MDLMLTLTVVPIMLWLMKLIFVVDASKIIYLENDNVVRVSYNLSMFVTLLYNNILCKLYFKISMSRKSFLFRVKYVFLSHKVHQLLFLVHL
jgi:hypothetical protein